jgi:hypothetical protein
MLLTGTVAWCWKCGANACIRARNLVRPCPGRPRGFLVHARQRLLLGLHPSSRMPLEASTVAEPGQSLPAGFSIAVQEAEASRTSAAELGTEGLTNAHRTLVTTPRLAALRERVLAKQAAAKPTSLHMLSPKRLRLRGKQPAPRAETVTAGSRAMQPASGRKP